MNDLEQFKETFITEASELSEDMESKLMNLDTENPDKEDINAIFRCAHSIKGGAGSFGFDRLVKFTHILEFLLDSVRNDEINLSEDIIDALLKSVDVLKIFISAAQNNEEAPEGYEDELLSRLKAMSEKNTTAKISPKAEEKKIAEEKQKEIQPDFYQYKIKFRPFRELFESGNEPLYIIRELVKNAINYNVSCDVSKIQSLTNLTPLDCYFTWEIFLQTKDNLAKVKEVFEFVEDECELEIIQETKTDLPTNVSSPVESEDGSWGLFEEYAEEARKKKEVIDNSGAWGLFDDNVIVATPSKPENAEVQATKPKPKTNASNDANEAS
ncbi:MAG: Hpt domain-containing protein, partial [Rickettsiales bacterium]|nr:Hpt domain-containing protein [Rickettsiales bacterium]